MKTVLDKDTLTVASESEAGNKSWTFRDAYQAAKHLPMFDDRSRPEAERITKGDASAIRDAANEFAKQAKS